MAEMIAHEELAADEREALEQVTGTVFDIQRFSLHDGPGIRTNVFFKGCPLRCQWCANPESQTLRPEPALTARECITCGQFPTPCPVCWSNQPAEGLTVRIELCPTGALHWIGEERTAGQIMAEVRKDVPFYGAGGGLTLTGGEATMQPELAEALLRLARAEGIATALETAGHTHWSVFERLVPYLDHILFDVKHVDEEVHRRYTGIGCARILDNLRQLVQIGAPVTVRVPLIPGFNTTLSDARAIAATIRELDHPDRRVDLLPYHALGSAKYRALGRDYPWANHERLCADEIEALVALFGEYGLDVRVGG